MSRTAIHSGHPVAVEIRIRAAAAMKLKSDAINSDRVNRHLGGRMGFMLSSV